MHELCLQEEDLDLVFREVNRSTPFMGVGNFYLQKRHRPMLGSQNDVKKLIKNLAFCWCVFHAKTFTILPYA
jgi:hypothetical protein